MPEITVRMRNVFPVLNNCQPPSTEQVARVMWTAIRRYKRQGIPLGYYIPLHHVIMVREYLAWCARYGVETQQAA